MKIYLLKLLRNFRIKINIFESLNLIFHYYFINLNWFYNKYFCNLIFFILKIK